MAQIVTITNPLTGQPAQVDQLDHTAQQIDDATARALSGGAIDQLLAGKAPDGYGLGSSGASISDCNLATSNGFYKWGSACDNAPFTYGCMIVASRYNAGTINLAQLAFQQTTTAGIARRSVIDGVFGEWEWINPPMVIGVEYRTTERYNGKPVYKKAVSIGSITGDGTLTFALSGAGTLLSGELLYRGYLPFNFINGRDLSNGWTRYANVTRTGSNIEVSYYIGSSCATSDGTIVILRYLKD